MKGFDMIMDPVTGFCTRVNSDESRNQYESVVEDLHERLQEMQREHRGEL